MRLLMGMRTSGLREIRPSTSCSSCMRNSSSTRNASTLFSWRWSDVLADYASSVNNYGERMKVSVDDELGGCESGEDENKRDEFCERYDGRVVAR